VKSNQLILNINSDDPIRLAAFYRDIVQLPPIPDMGESAFDAGSGAALIIDGHPEITGPTREPARYLVDFMVDDLAAEQARLEAAGVRLIRTAGQEPWGGVISTFVDPDGNYAQLIEFKMP
jgi:predicted enzyme related to lactoylglutathione lyase